MSNLEKDLIKLEAEVVSQSNLQPLTLKELMDTTFPPQKWVVDGLVPAGGITILCGTPGTFKTWLMMEMANKISAGNSLFDTYSTQSTNVLIIDEEMGARPLQERFKALDVNPANEIFIFSLKGLVINAATVETILDICDKNNIGLILIDSFVRVANITDENSSAQVNAVFALLKPLKEKGVSILMAHHSRKPNRNEKVSSMMMRGSSDIHASADSVLIVSRKDETHKLELHQTKSRHNPESEIIELEFINDPIKGMATFKYLGEAKPPDTKQVKARKAILSVLNNTEDRMNQKEIIEQVKLTGIDIGETNLKTAFQELSQEGEIATSKGKGKEKFYTKKESIEEPTFDFKD